MRDTASLLAEARLVPVLTVRDPAHAVPLGRALVAGGVRMLEVTLRTPCGFAAAEAIHREVEGAVVGIGTALAPGDLDRAQRAGFAFAVSPGATAGLLAHARDTGFALLPGVATPSELMLALEHGIGTCKLFPAEPAGGIPLLRALAGPFPQVRFCPTGGIGEDRIRDYLALPNVLAVGGSWLATDAEMAAGDWEAVTGRARRAVAALAA